MLDKVLFIKARLIFVTIYCSLHLIYISSCTRINNEELSKYWWKWGGGYNCGDVLMFTNGQEGTADFPWIFGDTIYVNNKPDLIVTDVIQKYDGHIRLHIESIETGKEGVYHKKGLRPELD